MKRIIFSLLLLIVTDLYAGNLIFNTRNNQYLEYGDFIESLPGKMHLVLGEYHYITAIQKIQAKIINDLVVFNGAQNNFTVAWEFLNYTDQENIDAIILSYKADELGDIDLFAGLFPRTDNQEINLSYLPIFQTLKNLNGKILAVNLPRHIKRQVTTGGIDNLNPDYLPPNLEIGGDDYFQRFSEAMDGHVSGEKLQRYFEAQCLTDSVISYQMNKFALTDLSFLVIGSFHSDYNHGTVTRLKNLVDRPVVSVKIIDAKEMTLSDIERILKPSSDYGALADYIFFINGIKDQRL